MSIKPAFQYGAYDLEREHSMADEGGAAGADMEGEPDFCEFLDEKTATPPPSSASALNLKDTAIAVGVLVLTFYRAYQAQKSKHL